MEHKQKTRLLVEDIQDMVEKQIMTRGRYALAKAYIIYRYNRALVRKANTTDDSILSLISNKNKDVMEENSNKNAVMVSTQRDLIAGEVSRDLTRRVVLPEKISRAHDDGVIHFHDADYFIQPMFNCCLVNLGDMLDNGTVMNGKLIESPKSFQVACTVMTQIIASVLPPNTAASPWMYPIWASTCAGAGKNSRNACWKPPMAKCPKRIWKLCWTAG